MLLDRKKFAYLDRLVLRDETQVQMLLDWWEQNKEWGTQIKIPLERGLIVYGLETPTLLHRFERLASGLLKHTLYNPNGTLLFSFVHEPGSCDATIRERTDGALTEEVLEKLCQNAIQVYDALMLYMAWYWMDGLRVQGRKEKQLIPHKHPRYSRKRMRCVVRMVYRVHVLDTKKVEDCRPKLREA